MELSVTQRRFFALAQHDARLRPPNITSVFELFGDLDAAVLQSALHEATARYELLRICYSKTAPCFEVHENTCNPIVYCAIQCDSQAVVGEIAQIAYRQQEKIFEPGEGPLLVGTILCVNHLRWFLVLTIDHMISDGLSIGLLIRDMCFIYLNKKRGRALSLPKPRGSYLDYVREEAELLRSAGHERKLWWVHELKGYVPAHTVMCPAPGPIGAVKSTIPAATFGEMMTRARQADLSISTVVLCAYAKAVTQAGLGTDILINKAISNRNQNMRGVFGDFMNLVPTRFAPHGKDISQLVQEMAPRVAASKEHQLPYWMLTESLFPEFYLHPYGISNIWFNYFPPHNRWIIDTAEMKVELLTDLTPPPNWPPCSVCLNVQPMLSGEAELMVLSNTNDVPDAARHTILREVESAIAQSVGWLDGLSA